MLVLCYGNGIAGRLENAMQDRAVEDRVQVHTFHSWCYRMLRAFDLPPPAPAEFSDYGECLREGVRRVVDAVERGLIPAGQYDAVLIDEAHDFEEDWLRLAVRMVNPSTRALMVVYDDAQAIYKGRVRPVWSQLGIEAKGRTTVLRVNYRNTAQILALAKRFAADVLGLPGLAADDEPDVLLPEHGGRQGPEPQLLGRVGLRDEAQAIADWLHARHAAGRAWSELAVLYPRHAIGRLLARVLAAAGVPIDVASDHRRRIDMRLDAVRLLTMHNAKGLEFPGVAIAGLGELGTAAAASEDDVRLTYVALTRATHELLLTYSRPTALVRRLLDCERG